MKKLIFLLIALVIGAAIPSAMLVGNVKADPHAGMSHNVAVIGSLYVANGGTFPTTTSGPTGAFTDFVFTVIPAASVTAANLANYDTVLYNVATNWNGLILTAQAQTDLVNWVATGKKLIIYDSECPAQNYSWLPYPFTTNNPGAMGAIGSSVIVEDNKLSNSSASNSHYINHTLLDTQTDAVGDMNVMTTYNANWCLDMAGTNYNHVYGPVHCYAHYGTPGHMGLIIYNGLDTDYMSSSTVPTSASGAGNIAKLWLQELQQPFNPDDLPCNNTVVGINLSPATATNLVGQTHTVTATLRDQGQNPAPGITVTFTVTGKNPATATAVTNASGIATYTYTGNGGIGQDSIVASFVNGSGITITSQTVTKCWTQLASLSAIKYRYGPQGYQFNANKTVFTEWLQVQFTNDGPGEARNVTATITCKPNNTTVLDDTVSLGNIPAGGSAWSTDTFNLRLDLTNANPAKNTVWQVDYDDSCGTHHTISNVPWLKGGTINCP
jgi:hypothetical protein